MYFRKIGSGFEEVRLKPGDRLIVNWHRRIFRAAAQLPAPERLRITEPREFFMGLVQPRWQRLWMQDRLGKFVQALPLPLELQESCVKDIDPFIMLPQQYGMSYVGGEDLQWSWAEEADFGRRLCQQTSYLVHEGVSGVRRGPS